MLAPETVLAGKYVILRPLESGGMGDVYDAFQKDLSRPVAIKLLRGDLVGDPGMFLRFRREAEAAASLGHPNIVQVLDFLNEPDEQPILVMEKLEGRSLRDLLADSATLAPQRAAFIALQILSALAAAHAANIVHRDVKPANVFILKTFAVRDFVKVLDFGIAKVLDPSAGALTDLGQVLGTASYMAPEQAKGLQVDGRADLFAVGGILFEALSGRRPRTLGPAGIIDAGLMPCLKLRDVCKSVDPRLAAVVDRALALDRNERFATAEAMAKALAPFAPQDLVDLGRTERPDRTAADPRSAPENALTVTGEEGGHPLPPPVAPTRSSPPIVLPPTAHSPHSPHLPPTVHSPHGPALAPMLPPTALSPHGSAPGDPARISGGLPQAPSAPSSNPVLAQVPSGAPSGPARTSYQPPMHHAGSVPPAYSPSYPPPGRAPSSGMGWGWLLILPILGVLVVIVGVVAFITLGSRLNDRDRTLVANARPATCSAPASCSGRVTFGGEVHAMCEPLTSLRPGDLLFYERNDTTQAGTFVLTTSKGRVRVASATGTTQDVDAKTVLGAYCVR